MTVEPRAVDPHCFDADPEPDPAQNLDADPDSDPDADPDPDPGGGGVGGLGQPKMCIPPDKILGTPLKPLPSNPSNRVTSSSCYNFVRVLLNFLTGLLPLFVKISHF